MGALTDLLQSVPLNAVLREKMSAFEEENASLKQENAALKDVKRQLEGEIVKLTDEIKRLAHTDDLDEAGIKILTHLARAGGAAHTSDIARAVDLHGVNPTVLSPAAK